MQHIMVHSGGMQEWVIQIPSIPILVSVLFPSLHLRIKFLLLVPYSVCSVSGKKKKVEIGLKVNFFFLPDTVLSDNSVS